MRIALLACVVVGVCSAPAFAQDLFCYDYDAEGRIEVATRNDGSQLDYGFTDPTTSIVDRNDSRETLAISTTATANCASPPTNTGNGGNDLDPPNYAPVAVLDGGFVYPGQFVTITVLANDHDPNGQPIWVSSHTNPSVGSVTLSSNVFTYTAPSSPGVPNTTFAYTITDGDLTDTSSVTINFLGGP